MKPESSRPRALRPLAALSSVLLFAVPLAGQIPQDRIAQAARTEAAPLVDGNLDEAAWGAAPLLDGFVQRDPFEGQGVSERTEMRILFDGDAIYIGAWLYDSQAASIVYGETRRDANPENSDAVMLMFDTYRDGQNGFLFATTPAGIEYDGQITREGQGGGGIQRRQNAGSGGGFNVNWDGSWEVATSRDNAGWYAEFRIPFSTLRYAAGGAQEWGINMTRRIRRRNEESFWSPVARQFDVFRVSSAGLLTGVEAPGRRSMTLTPYTLLSGRRDYAANPGPDDTSSGDVGFDAKLVTASSLTLDLTYNTDFAQVEVDEQEVNLTRFRLFFPEKRPFFLENAGTFSLGTPQENELFFSRRIGIADGGAVPILGGGRVTGRVGGVTLGLLDIQTERVDGAAPANNFSVARVLKEYGNRTRFGAMIVSRLNTDDSDDHNVAVAADGRVGIGESLTLEGYLAGTETPGIEDDRFSGSAQASWNSRDWEFAGTYRRVGEGFNPEVGFSPRGEHKFRSMRVLRRVRFDDVSWFKEMRPHISYREHLSLAGFSETRLLHVDSHFEFSNGAFFQLPAINFTREGLEQPFEISEGIVLAPGIYDNVDWGFAFNSNLSAPISVQGRLDLGGFYNGFRAGTSSTLNARVSDTFVASLRLDLFDVNLDEGEFRTSVISLRGAYSFTPRIYVQSLLQYNDQTDSFSGNVRFGWLNTAGTGLFVVFNDLRHTGTFEETGIPRGPLDRSLVIKFTKQFDLIH